MTLQKPKAVIFDWDDTIVKIWPVLHAAINETLKAFDHEPWTEEEAHARIGPPARILFTELFGEDRWEEADRIFIEAYADMSEKTLTLHDHAKDILQLLHDAGIYMVVVSTKRDPLLQKDVQRFGMEPFFGCVVGSGVAEKDKPEREIVDYALKDSSIVPGPDVWFIGDSKTDLICAQNAGCVPILVKTKPPTEEVLAQYPPAAIFETHQEMQKAFADLLKDAAA